MNYLQGLAGDWIRQLAAESDASAKLAVPNVFTQTQLVTPPGDDYAGLDITSAPSNKWRLLLKGHTGLTSSGNEAEIRVYVGQGTEAYFAVVFNAYYRHASNAWRQQNITLDSRAIIISPGGIELTFQAAGSADWTTWGYSNTKAAAYDTPDTTRDVVIPLASVIGDGVSRSATEGYILTDGSGNRKAWPLVARLPENCTWGNIEVLINQSASSANSFRVKTRANSATTSAPSVSVTSTVTSTIASGQQLLTLSVSGTTHTANEDVELEWNGGVAGDAVQQITMRGLVDRGPRNY
jgi:hypothetical protein